MKVEVLGTSPWSLNFNQRLGISGVFRISKRGANFHWPTFPIFLVCQKNFFLAKGGAMAQWPSLNTPLLGI